MKKLKPSALAEENSINDAREIEETSDEKLQNHKCSISTMLNDEPVSPTC